MLPVTKKTWLLVNPSDPDGDAIPTPSSWEHLDAFLERLQAGEDVGRLLLETACVGTRADVVFLCPASPGQPLEVLGEPALTPDWCSTFTEKLLRQTPDKEGPLHGPVPADIQPAPVSVLLVRWSKTPLVWFGALRFPPRRGFWEGDVHFLHLLRRIQAGHQHQVQAAERLKDTFYGLVRCLVTTLDAREPYSWGHSERVARVAVRLGRQMNLREQTLGDLYLGGLLHDLGMVGISDAVLRKPGPLTEEERAFVREHPVIGEAILMHVKPVAHLRPLVRNHHERFDGTGYPDGLKGEAIPLLTRILTLAAAVAAMTADRPHRKALSPEEIDAVLTAGAGTEWDPEVVRHYFGCRDDLFAICRHTAGDSVLKAIEQALEGSSTFPRHAPSMLALGPR